MVVMPNRTRTALPALSVAHNRVHVTAPISGRCGIFPLKGGGEYPAVVDPLAIPERSVRPPDVRRAAPEAPNSIRTPDRPVGRLCWPRAGGRPSERLMARLDMPVSSATILRSIKESVGAQSDGAMVRIAGIDERGWRV
jgi:hypothetical protein